MSYSFTVTAPTKGEAYTATLDKFDEVVKGMPVHARDRAIVLSHVHAMLDVLGDDDTKDVMVSVNGHASWSSGGDPATAAINTIASGASVYHTQRK